MLDVRQIMTEHFLIRISEWKRKLESYAARHSLAPIASTLSRGGYGLVSFGIAVKWLWRLVCNIAGAAMVVITLAIGVLLLFAVILGVTNGDLPEKWPVLYWMTVISLSMFAFLNMLFFFWRLKRVSPSLYYAATEGWSASAYLMSSRSAFRLLHGWVVRIASDRNGPFAASLRVHATITRLLNVGCLIGWMSLLIMGIGLFAYVKYLGTS